MVRVSVIIPVYNTEKYLQKCLESVCNQTLRDIEIICVNDCSTDGSLAILQEYAVHDGRIHVITNGENLRAGISRNIGLQNAVSEYVYFMDSDDYIDADYLQQMYDNAVRHNADIVTNTNVLKETAGKIVRYMHPSMPIIPIEGCFVDNATAIDNFLCTVWIRLYRRSLLVDNSLFFDKLDARQDMVFHYIVNLYAKSIYVFGGPNYYYTVRDDSISGIVETNNTRDLKTMKAYDLIYDFLFERDMLKTNKTKIFNVSGFFKVDTEEKFIFYKSYFEKIKGYLTEHEAQYNAMDLFFANCILSCNSFEDYKKQYSSSVAIAFLRNRGKNG